MFRKFIVLCLAVLLILIMGYTAFSKMSATQTGDAAIISGGGAGWFLGIMIITDGTNDVDVDVYDNASAASGTKLIPTWTVKTSTSNRAATLGFEENEVPFYNGLYVDVATSGTVSYMVYYTERQ